MRNNTMKSLFGDGLQYETPRCRVVKLSLETTILSNQPGTAGDYNSDDDIVFDGDF